MNTYKIRDKNISSDAGEDSWKKAFQLKSAFSAIPSFLIPIKNQILITGKSIKLIQYIEKVIETQLNT